MIRMIMMIRMTRMIMIIMMIIMFMIISIHPDCVVPESELRLAKKNYQWWKSFLGDYYRFSIIAISLLARSHVGFEKHEEEKINVPMSFVPTSQTLISSFRGFFDATNTPKKNFKKIQHLKVMNGTQRERLQE